MKNFSHSLLRGAGLLLLGSITAVLHATVTLHVKTTVSSPQVVGSSIGIQAKATSTGSGPVSYRFELQSPSSTAFTMLSDFSLDNQFTWAANGTDGTYVIRVTARDHKAGTVSTPFTKDFIIAPLVTGVIPVAEPTAHPLVALFSAPSCPAGSSMRVKFQLSGTKDTQYTDFRPCLTSTMNFLIGGMEQVAKYDMNFQVQTGATIISDSHIVSFTTGSIPASVPIPATGFVVPAGLLTSSERINLFSTGSAKGAAASVVFATDLQGRTVWYNTAAIDQLTRPVRGGTLLQLVQGVGTGTGPWGYVAPTKQQVLQETDLAGNILRQTSSDRVSEQLPATAIPLGLDRFSHEARKLPDGNYLVLAETQKSYPAGTQGSLTPIDLIGAVILILDPNFQVIWYWNAFNHSSGGTQLDANRAPTFKPDKCKLKSYNNASPGCPPAIITGFSSSIDWLHANALQLLPDGSITISLRNQSWVAKINYGNGTGDGSVLWRMGVGGDFTFQGTSDKYPWFSGQHDPEFIPGSLTTMSIFDDGNTRTALQGGNSRGQVLNVNESAKTVTFILNADLGARSDLLGSSQQLANGDWFFDNGSLSPQRSGGQTVEVKGDGTQTFNESVAFPAYRAFRLTDFYDVPQ